MLLPVMLLFSVPKMLLPSHALLPVRKTLAPAVTSKEAQKLLSQVSFKRHILHMSSRGNSRSSPLQLRAQQNQVDVKNFHHLKLD